MQNRTNINTHLSSSTFCVLLSIAALLGSSTATIADDAKEEIKPITPAKIERKEPVDFDADIYPIFELKCIACHNTSYEESRFNLETVELIRKGGKRGTAVVAGEPDKSLIYILAAHAKNPVMPPPENDADAEPLTPEELGLLRQWILEGAKMGKGMDEEVINWRPLPATMKSIYSVAVSPRNNLIAAGRTNRLHLYDARTGSEITQLVDPTLIQVQVDGKPIYPNGAAHLDLIHSIAFSNNGQLLATGGYRVVKLWQQQRNVQSQQVSLATEGTTLAASQDRQWLATGTSDGSIQLSQIGPGTTAATTLTGHSTPIRSLAFATVSAEQLKAGQLRLVSTADDSTIRLWDISIASDNGTQTVNGQQVGILTSPVPVKQLAVNPQGTQIAAACNDGLIRIWNLNDLPKSETPQPEKAEANAENKAGESPEAKAAPAPVAELKSHEKPVSSVLYLDAKGEQLVSADESGIVHVWDVTKKASIRNWNHKAAVLSMSATSDGTKLVTTGADGEIRMWNVAEGKPIWNVSGDIAAKFETTDLTDDKTVAEQQLAVLNEQLKAAETDLKQRTEAKTKADEALKKAQDALPDIQKKQNEADAALAAAKKELTENKPLKAAEQKVAETQKAATDSKMAAEQSVKTLQQAQEAEKQAQIALTAAKKELDAKPDDEALKKKFADATTAVNDATAALKKATDEKVAADKQKTTADAALVAAQKELEAKKKDDSLKKKVDAAQKVATDAAAATKKANDEIERAKKTVERSVQAIANSEKNKAAALAKRDDKDKQVKSATEQLTQAQTALKESVKPVVASAISPNGSTLATSGINGTLQLWDVSTGHSVSQIGSEDKVPAAAICFTADSQVASTGANKKTIVWKVHSTWKLIARLGADKENPLSLNGSPFANRVLALDFNHNDELLATGGGDPSRSGEIHLWNLKDFSLQSTLKEPHSDTVLSLQFSRDGQHLLSGASDKFVKLFDVASGKYVRSYEGHTHHVLGVTWKADGYTIASAGADNAIKIWNVETGEQRRTISNHGKQVTALKYIGVGDLIASCGGDKSVRLHKTSDGKQVRTFAGGTDYMHTLAVTADQKLIIASGDAGVLRIWNGKDGKPVTQIAP